MNIEQGILGQQKKPGPLERAANSIGIAAIAQPKPAVLDPFAYRGGYPESALKGPVSGPGSPALTPSSQGILAPGKSGTAPVSSASKSGPAPGEQVSALIGAVDQGARGAGNVEVKQPSGDHGVSQNTGIAAPSSASTLASANDSELTGPQGGMVESNQKGLRDVGPSNEPASPAAVVPQGIASTMSDAKLRQGVRSRKLGIGDFQSGTGVIVGSDGKVTRIDSQPLPGVAQPQQPAGGENILAQAASLARSSNANDRVIAAKMFRHGNDFQLKQAQTQGLLVQNSSAAMRADLEEKAIGGDAQAMAMLKSLSVKTEQTGQGEKLTMPQRRSNFEIEAARKAIAGLTADEIKRKTANFTATGRENPDFDPTLAKAVSLAGRRMYGADDHFDQRDQAQQRAQRPAGNDGDVMTRFRADQAMQGHRLGNQTDQGTEVIDASGRLIGHYR